MSRLRGSRRGACAALVPALCLACLTLSYQPCAEAQVASNTGLQKEVFGSAGIAHLFRFDDDGLGSGPIVGGGVAFRHHSGLGFEIRAHRTLGLSAKAGACGIVTVSCVLGGAREGVTGVTIASVNALYHFGKQSRTQPFVTAGVGALWSSGKSALLQVQGTNVIFEEESWRDTGLALNWGGGIRIQAAKSLSVQPELRLYHATLLSRANLSLLGASVSVGYTW